jgi:hypothetical protein
VSGVWIWDGEKQQARCWQQLARREVGADNISHYGLSNAPLDTPWQELAQVQVQRFFIEHRFREAKSECGMADYPIRRWDAWHNPMALVMLGTLVLVKQKISGRHQWPMLSFNDLVTALGHLLPRRQLTAEGLADIISKRHYLPAERLKNHTPEGLKWLVNESDKVELNTFFFIVTNLKLENFSLKT